MNTLCIDDQPLTTRCEMFISPVTRHLFVVYRDPDLARDGVPLRTRAIVPSPEGQACDMARVQREGVLIPAHHFWTYHVTATPIEEQEQVTSLGLFDMRTVFQGDDLYHYLKPVSA